MKTENKAQKTEEEKLFSGILWLNMKALGLALGLLFGLAVFIATNAEPRKALGICQSPQGE